MKYAFITIKVPVEDLEIDAEVSYEEPCLYSSNPDDYTEGGHDVTVNDVEIKACEYEVVEWEDTEVDEQAIINWQEGK